MIPALTNHLWQSTAFAFAAWLIVFALRRNRAAIRYGVWLSASLKFLVPLAWLLSLGSALPHLSPTLGDVVSPAATAASSLPIYVNRITEPFSSDIFDPSPLPTESHAGRWIPAVLGAMWIAGVVCVLSKRLRDWGRVKSALRASHPVELGTAVPVRSAPALLEPGVVGIRRPVLLVPAGLELQLTPAQLRAVLEHEMTHVRRRDNLTSALHMVVELVFWFHPLVWWIGARLVEERENACDEHVLRVCGEPRAYAEGILRVCRHYVESPLACVSGVTGADIKRRVRSIMSERVGLPLGAVRRFGLVAVATLLFVLPVFAGIVSAPLRASAINAIQDSSTGARFDVVSIKPCGGPAITGGGGAGGSAGSRGAPPSQTMVSPGYARWDCATLAQLIDQAYTDVDHPLLNTTAHPRLTSLQPKHVRGGPSLPSLPAWVEHDTFTIEAKGPAELAGDTRPLMTLPAPLAAAARAMLEERFHLAVHRATEPRDVYALRVAKTGLDTRIVTPPKPGDCFNMEDFAAGGRASPPYETKLCGKAFSTIDRGTQYGGLPLSQLAHDLSPLLDQFVRDETGITGTFNFWLELPHIPPPTEDQIKSAVRKLGLTIETMKVQGEYIVIDHVERPTPNAPGARLVGSQR